MVFFLRMPPGAVLPPPANLRSRCLTPLRPCFLPRTEKSYFSQAIFFQAFLLQGSRRESVFPLATLPRPKPIGGTEKIGYEFPRQNRSRTVRCPVSVVYRTVPYLSLPGRLFCLFLYLYRDRTLSVPFHTMACLSNPLDVFQGPTDVAPFFFSFFFGHCLSASSYTPTSTSRWRSVPFCFLRVCFVYLNRKGVRSPPFSIT